MSDEDVISALCTSFREQKKELDLEDDFSSVHVQGRSKITVSRSDAAASKVSAVVDAAAPQPSSAFRPDSKLVNAIADATVLAVKAAGDWKLSSPTKYGRGADGEVPTITLTIKTDGVDTYKRVSYLQSTDDGTWNETTDDGTFTAPNLTKLLIDSRKLASVAFAFPAPSLEDTTSIPHITQITWASDKYLGPDGQPDPSNVTDALRSRNRLANRKRLSKILPLSRPHVHLWKLVVEGTARKEDETFVVGLHVPSDVYFVCKVDASWARCSYSLHDLIETAYAS